MKMSLKRFSLVLAFILTPLAVAAAPLTTQPGPPLVLGVGAFGGITGNLPSAMAGTNNSAVVTITSGAAADSTKVTVLTGAGYSWAVSNGDAANGYQGGTSLPAATTIHFFLCQGTSGVGSFASTSESSPTCPSGYNAYFRRVFSLNTFAQVTPTTVTISIATPAVISWTANSMVLGQPLTFSTSGTLPTGITAGTTYYVCTTGANSFEIATSLANALASTCLATSGSQSGTQTANPQALVPVNVDEIAGGAIVNFLNVQINQSGTIATSPRTAVAVPVPLGVKVQWLGRMNEPSNTTYCIVTSGDETDVAPISGANFSAAPGNDFYATSTFAAGQFQNKVTLTDTNGNIYNRCSASATVDTTTSGWVDFRRN